MLIPEHCNIESEVCQLKRTKIKHISRRKQAKLKKAKTIQVTSMASQGSMSVASGFRLLACDVNRLLRSRN